MYSHLRIRRYCYQGVGHRHVRAAAAVQGKCQWEILDEERENGRSRGDGHPPPPLAGVDLTWLDAAVVGGGVVPPMR